MAVNFDFETVQETLPGGSTVNIGYVSGAIDSTTNEIFEGEMKKILDEGAGNLVLVLKDVKYINSTGMGALIKFADSFRAIGGDIQLVAVPRKVEALFEMLGLLSLFKTFPTEEDALADLSDSEAEVVTEEAAAAEEDDEAHEEIPEGEDGHEAPDEEGEEEDDDEESVYPVHFACPSCQTRIQISKAGRYKCPKCSAFYSASSEGGIKAIRLEESKLVELKIPCDLKFTEGLKSMVKTYTREYTYSDKLLDQINRAIDESWALVVGKAERESDICQVFMVGNSQELITGFLVSSEPFSEDPSGSTSRAFKVINQNMDLVELTSLPSGGQLLKMVKKV